jgi:hypothetical protein
MAKYIGLLTSDARGKVGGLVMTRARTGSTMKAHSGAINPRSTFQANCRASFATGYYAWRLLTDPNRTTWDLLATQFTYLNSLAQPYQPTGLQLWQQAWVCAALAGGTPPSLAPAIKPSIPQPDALAAANVVGDLDITATTASLPYAGAWVLSSSFIVPPTLNYTTGIRRRPMGFNLGGDTINATGPWVHAYGIVPLSGAWLALRAVPFDLASYITGTPVPLLVQVT